MILQRYTRYVCLVTSGMYRLHVIKKRKERKRYRYDGMTEASWRWYLIDGWRTRMRFGSTGVHIARTRSQESATAETGLVVLVQA